MCELAAFASGLRAALRIKRIGGDDVQVEQEARDKGGDEGGGRSETSLMYIWKTDASLVECRERLQRV